MTVITPEELDRLERLCAAATPGPWEVDSADTADSCGHYSTYEISHGDGPMDVVVEFSNATVAEIHEDFDEGDVIRWDEVSRRNAAFIAAARTALPDLIAEVRRLTAELASMTAQSVSLTADLYARDAEVERLREALKPTSREANAWGVVSDEGILLRTISDTRRAATVNWLITKGGTMVYRSTPDTKIEQWWQELAPKGTAVVALCVTEVLAPIPPEQEGEGK